MMNVRIIEIIGAHTSVLTLKVHMSVSVQREGSALLKGNTLVVVSVQRVALSCTLLYSSIV